ncbi:MAG: (2Fe-2S)-binding protein [Herpetosiphonaceae bacterium]|nr:(2Fe-2S)-binding protein [Herpetosiphonaceae bacterium]
MLGRICCQYDNWDGHMSCLDCPKPVHSPR